MAIADPDGDPEPIDVLEDRLRVLARDRKLVAEPGEGDLAAVVEQAADLPGDCVQAARRIEDLAAQP